MSLQIKKIHHVAIICSNYSVSKHFYTNVLGLEARHEYYRAERGSMKCDLYLNENYVLELFSFPEPPARPSRPEACGLRHLAFGVEWIEPAWQTLANQLCAPEAIRMDEFTGKRFFFIEDPDGLPIEFYEL